MSSFPGHTLEDFVRDAYMLNTEAEYQAMVAYLEPAREYVEQALDHYEPEECSWRDYRNNLAYMIQEIINAHAMNTRRPIDADRLEQIERDTLEFQQASSMDYDGWYTVVNSSDVLDMVEEIKRLRAAIKSAPAAS